jgi:hypothetical protein
MIRIKADEAFMKDCTKTKRIVAFCADALDELGSTAPLSNTWDRRWASLLALLRTACEVLKKDAPNYWRTYMEEPNTEQMERGRKNKNRDQEKSWQPPIFGKFIQTYSNLFLHQGRTAEDKGMMPHSLPMGMFGPQMASMPPPDAQRGPPTRHTDLPPPYQGKDPLEVAKEAVDWLEAQIKIAEV